MTTPYILRYNDLSGEAHEVKILDKETAFDWADELEHNNNTISYVLVKDSFLVRSWVSE